MSCVIESMTRVPFFTDSHDIRHHYVLRAWRTEVELLDRYDNDDIRKTVLACASTGCCPAEIVYAVAGMERVAAVEVVDHEGNGPVYYTEWP